MHMRQACHLLRKDDKIWPLPLESYSYVRRDKPLVLSFLVPFSLNRVPHGTTSYFNLFELLSGNTLEKGVLWKENEALIPQQPKEGKAELQDTERRLRISVVKLLILAADYTKPPHHHTINFLTAIKVKSLSNWDRNF